MAVVAGVMLAAGCAGKKEAAPATESTGSGSGAGSGVTAAPRDAPKPDTDAVQAVVDAWLAAQNAGDLTAYAALYAEKFGGIKRAGPRTWKFDRAGWLKDRGRMFKAPMVVAATDIKISGTPAAASVLFTQSYTQGTFKDRGEKQLVIVKDGAGYKIAREEMLRSELTEDADAPGLPRYLFASIGATTMVILGTATTETHGALSEVIGQTDPRLATAAVTGPVATAKQTLAVIAADGSVCIGDVTSRVLVAGGTPHVGSVQEWDGGYDGQTTPATPAERAEAIFGMTSPYVAGVVANGGGVCHGVMAVPVGTVVKAFVVTNDAPLETAAVTAFRQLGLWKELQDEWKSTYSGDGPWEQSAVATTFAGHGRTFVVVSAREGTGCGEFLGALGAVFEVKAGKPVLLGAHGALDVEAIFDTNSDGAIEIVANAVDWSTEVAILEPDGNSLSTAEAVTFPFNDCGC